MEEKPCLEFLALSTSVPKELTMITNKWINFTFKIGDEDV
jgi:hypothetical protein